MLRSVTCRVGGFLLKDAPAGRTAVKPVAVRSKAADPSMSSGLVVVAGMASDCGSTTVALGLGLALARLARGGAAMVAGTERFSVRAVGTGRGRRLGNQAIECGFEASRIEACGPLALVRLPEFDRADPADVESLLESLWDLRTLARAIAPVVVDLGALPADTLSALVEPTDALVLVAGGDADESLVDLAELSLTESVKPPYVVRNRFVQRGRTRYVVLPASWRAARRIRSGRLSRRGVFGRSLADLAESVVERVEPGRAAVEGRA